MLIGLCNLENCEIQCARENKVGFCQNLSPGRFKCQCIVRQYQAVPIIMTTCGNSDQNCQSDSYCKSLGMRKICSDNNYCFCQGSEPPPPIHQECDLNYCSRICAVTDMKPFCHSDSDLPRCSCQPPEPIGLSTCNPSICKDKCAALRMVPHCMYQFNNWYCDCLPPKMKVQIVITSNQTFVKCELKQCATICQPQNLIPICEIFPTRETCYCKRKPHTSNIEIQQPSQSGILSVFTEGVRISIITRIRRLCDLQYCELRCARQNKIGYCAKITTDYFKCECKLPQFQFDHIIMAPFHQTENYCERISMKKTCDYKGHCFCKDIEAAPPIPLHCDLDYCGELCSGVNMMPYCYYNLGLSRCACKPIEQPRVQQVCTPSICKAKCLALGMKPFCSFRNSQWKCCCKPNSIDIDQVVFLSPPQPTCSLAECSSKCMFLQLEPFCDVYFDKATCQCRTPPPLFNNISFSQLPSPKATEEFGVENSILVKVFELCDLPKCEISCLQQNKIGICNKILINKFKCICILKHQQYVPVIAIPCENNCQTDYCQLMDMNKFCEGNECFCRENKPPAPTPQICDIEFCGRICGEGNMDPSCFYEFGIARCSCRPKNTIVVQEFLYNPTQCRNKCLMLHMEPRYIYNSGTWRCSCKPTTINVEMTISEFPLPTKCILKTCALKCRQQNLEAVCEVLPYKETCYCRHNPKINSLKPNSLFRNESVKEEMLIKETVKISVISRITRLCNLQQCELNCLKQNKIGFCENFVGDQFRCTCKKREYQITHITMTLIHEEQNYCERIGMEKQCDIDDYCYCAGVDKAPPIPQKCDLEFCGKFCNGANMKPFCYYNSQVPRCACKLHEHSPLQVQCNHTSCKAKCTALGLDSVCEFQEKNWECCCVPAEVEIKPIILNSPPTNTCNLTECEMTCRLQNLEPFCEIYSEKSSCECRNPPPLLIPSSRFPSVSEVELEKHGIEITVIRKIFGLCDLHECEMNCARQNTVGFCQNLSPQQYKCECKARQYQAVPVVTTTCGDFNQSCQSDNYCRKMGMKKICVANYCFCRGNEPPPPVPQECDLKYCNKICSAANMKPFCEYHNGLPHCGCQPQQYITVEQYDALRCRKKCSVLHMEPNCLFQFNNWYCSCIPMKISVIQMVNTSIRPPVRCELRQCATICQSKNLQPVCEIFPNKETCYCRSRPSDSNYLVSVSH